MLKRIYLFSFVILAVLASVSFAIDNALEVDGSWNTGSSWSLGHVPTISEKALIPPSSSPAIVDRTCTIGNGVSAYTQALKLAWYGGGSLTVQSGGTLETAAVVIAGNNIGGTLNVDGGSIECEGDFTFGSVVAATGVAIGNGVVNVSNGGTINIGETLRMARGTAGTGVSIKMNISDGSVTARALEAMDFQGIDLTNTGELYLIGDQVSWLKAQADAGFITAASSSAPRVVFITYDSASNKTVARAATAEDLNKAYDPSPVYGAENLSPEVTFSWTPGDSALTHNLYYGTSLSDVDGGATAKVTGLAYDANSYSVTLDIGETYYWRVDGVDSSTTWTGDIWQISIAPGEAILPVPVDSDTDIAVNKVLSWTAGAYMVSQDVYLSEDVDEVSNSDVAALLGSTSQLSFGPLALERNKTYYWKVDTIGASGTWSGGVWTFSTEGYDSVINSSNITAVASSEATLEPRGAYRTLDGSGLDATGLIHDNYKTNNWTTVYGSGGGDVNPHVCTVAGKIWIEYEFDKPYSLGKLWVWNNNWENYTFWGLKNVTIEYSVTGSSDANDWYNLGDFQFAQATGLDDYEHNTEVDFGGVEAKYVVITANSVEGAYTTSVNGNFGLAEVLFHRNIPFSSEPYPADDGEVAKDIMNTLVLTWDAGSGAEKHDVYFGDDLLNVSIAGTSSAVYMGQQLVDANSYAAGANESLEVGKTYYWRVDEIQGSNVWRGEVWSFSIQGYVVIDDMESYSNDDAIWYVWNDAFANGTGAMIGTKNNADPYHEYEIFHGGTQSMYYAYDNSQSPYYSEGFADTSNFSYGSDWTAEGVKSIDVWFRGTAGNSAETLYIVLSDGSDNEAVVYYDGASSDLGLEEWKVFHAALSDFSGVNLSNVQRITIGIGDRQSPAVGGTGVVYIDDIRLYTPRCVPEFAPSGDLNGDCVVNLFDVQVLIGQWLDGDGYVNPIAPQSPVAYWPFDTSSGGTTPEIISGNDGALMGNAKIQADAQRGNALYLDGNGDYVTHNFALPLSQGTISHWLKPYQWDKNVAYYESDGSTINHNGFGSGPEILEIHTAVGANMDWYSIYQDGEGAKVVQGGSVAAAQWQHVAVSWEVTGDLVLYVNGYEVSRTDMSDKTFDPTRVNDVHVIGSVATLAERFWAGFIDDVKVFDYALSNAEILSLADGSSIYYSFSSEANLYDAEAAGSKKINFKDYASLLEQWLDQQLWPVN